MYRYIIKKDGFTLGQAKGKNDAINKVKRHLTFSNCLHLAKWSNQYGNISCLVNNGQMEEYYTIERDNQ